MLAVRWYLRYGLSYRDVEDLLAERGIVVDHVTIYRWVQRFSPELIDAARPSRHVAGDRWFVDETSLKGAGPRRRAPAGNALESVSPKDRRRMGRSSVSDQDWCDHR
jgi:hypothetical protein